MKPAAAWTRARLAAVLSFLVVALLGVFQLGKQRTSFA
jgi:hypothetical protein